MERLIMIMNKTFSIIFVLLFSAGLIAAQNFSAPLLKKHISFLSSDALEGRATGSKGADIAAEYIFQELKSFGLLPFRQNFSFKYSPEGQGNSDSIKVQLNGFNIAAFLDNGKKETIIIGAHYDHLGFGHDGNSMDPEAKGQIHNGADDNASGVAGLLELARYYATNNKVEEVNYYFIAFSGEENGLFGSKSIADFLLNNQPSEKNEIVKFKAPSDCKIMLNLDMIGRVNPEEKKLMIYGSGTAAGLPEILQSIELKSYKMIYDSSGVGPSDHASFYFKNIPVLHFFSGQHAEYHKPTDDESLINYAGMIDILDFMRVFCENVQTKPLTFQATRNNQIQSRNFKVTLGVMPDYTFEGPGLRLDGVSEGKPAKKAGLMRGDIILKMDQTEILNMKTYMGMLSKYNKGEKVQLEVKRGETRIVVSATF
jgi:hypothetical protein